MRTLIVAIATFLSLTSVAIASDHPLAESKITIRAAPPGKHALSYRGFWNGSVTDLPALPTATLQVTGGPGEGGTTQIALDPTAWQELNNAKGYKYVDRTASAGGVKKVIIKNGTPTKPGKVRIVAGKASFVYDVLAEHTEVALELVVDDERWCAFAYDPTTRSGKIKAKEEGASPGCAIDTVVDVAWLEAHLGDGDVQVVDTRPSFSGGHIPGAIPITPMSLATTVGGIPLQMVDEARGEEVLDEAGLVNDATVVVYGDPPEYDPARVMWALRYLGHGDVRYLDGGFGAWVAAGAPVDAGPPTAAGPTGYTIDAPEPDLRVDGAWILNALGPAPYDTSTIQVVDARELSEYVSGHIPTAVLAPWGDNLDGGALLPPVDLDQVYEGLGLDPTKTTVVYCLAGWRAAVGWLSLVWLGFDDVRVYDGSWIEWGAGGFPIETGAP